VLSLGPDAQAASQILLSVGQLRFQPPAAITDSLVDGEQVVVPAAWLALEHHCVAAACPHATAVYVRCLEKQQYTNHDLNAFLDGCALLGGRLSPAAVESCLKAVSAVCSSNPSDAPRCISTAAWALAHLQASTAACTPSFL
jgi:hypothetical protein